MLLREAIETSHYQERKEQRGTIVSLLVPESLYKVKPKEEIESAIIPKLQAELDRRLQELEQGQIGRSNNVNLGIKVFNPVVYHQGKKYPVVMDTGNGRGTSYLVVATNNTLITIYPTSKVTPEEIEETVKDHLRRERPEDLRLRPPAAYVPANATYVVDLEGEEVVEKEKKPEEQKVTEDSLDYVVRTDYRVGATFKHKQYGEGVITSAAGGGKGGVNGKVDWIEVKYKKPFLKGGKLQDTRRFENILTSAYFGKTLKKPEMSLEEVKSTCCGKCGHVHVKGTSCPKPHLTGKRHCSRRTDEMHTLDQDGYDEFHQVRADHEESIEEMSLTSSGIPEFLDYIKANPETVAYFGFPSYKSLLDYVLEANPREWYELKRELEAFKGQNLEEEVSEYCPACLAEYLLEYQHKLEEAEYRGRKVTLGKPFLTPGGPKKRSVYVKNAKGNVVKVNFGDPNLRIKKSNPKRRKSFRARHKCHTAKDRTTPRYWSCKFW